MRRRVLFVNHSAVLGGGELYLLDVARRFGRSGAVLLLSDGPLRERLQAAGVDVEVLQAGGRLLGVRREQTGLPWRAAAALAWIVPRVARRARGFELLYANSQKAFIVAVLAGRLARRPVVWHLQDILSPEHFSARNIRLVVALANRFAARVVANSRATADAFLARGGDARKVRVVYNGFDSATPAAADSDDADVRAEFGVGNSPLIGVFARFHPWKGQHVVIEALARLPGVHALLVGEPLFGEDDYFAETRAQARRLGLDGRAHFAGFRNDVPRLMRAVDVVIHPSVAAEPFGRVVVEGMLAGRPVVAASAGGVAEIIEDGATGVLVPPGDPRALADAVAGLLADPPRREALARAGREHARRKFTLDACVAGVAAVLAEVAAP